MEHGTWNNIWKVLELLLSFQGYSQKPHSINPPISNFKTFLDPGRTLIECADRTRWRCGWKNAELEAERCSVSVRKTSSDTLCWDICFAIWIHLGLQNKSNKHRVSCITQTALFSCFSTFWSMLTQVLQLHRRNLDETLCFRPMILIALPISEQSRKE